MPPYHTIIKIESGETAQVILNRPKLNLFNEQMITELIHVWHSLQHRTDIRFIILSAKGVAFSAGADLKEFAALVGKEDKELEKARLLQLRGHELMNSLQNLEQITIAAVQGAALGGGMAIAMACDFRIMTKESYFGIPETSLGTFFTWGCTPRLVQMVGKSRAMELIMAWDRISARDAFLFGLANRVVGESRLMEAVHKLIAKIGARSPHAVRISKKIANAASLQGFGNIFAYEPEICQYLIQLGDIEKQLKKFQKNPSNAGPISK